MQIIGIIPARYASTRFPGKMLSLIKGKPLIQHVYERVAAMQKLSCVVVACDDIRIYDAVKSCGGEALMTALTHSSGTDRVAEAARLIGGDIIINIQGDEPLIKPYMIDALLRPFVESNTTTMATLAYPLTVREEIENPHIVKIVKNNDGRALYFSRAPIPYIRDKNRPVGQMYWGHIGIYAYTNDFLQHITRLPVSQLETIECLEQVRVLEYGYTIQVVEVEEPTIGVDIPSDIQKIEELL